MDPQQSTPPRSMHERHRSEAGDPTSGMRTQPLPLTLGAPRHAPDGPFLRFALPFLAVLGYYALGICTFAVMAAGNVPGGGDVPQLAWYATETTSPIALAIALAAGRWWV